MCTITFIPTPSGCRFGMNRDEQRSRAKGIFPAPRLLGGLPVLGPSEPAGGMWTGANAATGAFALLNWNCTRQGTAKLENPLSRGLLVKAAAGCRQPADVEAQISQQPLFRIRSFRLLEIFAASKTLREWRWDGQELTRISCAWEPRLWASSSADEAAAQRARQAVFQRALTREGAGSLEWLRALHRTHLPEKGALSICMHRKEAATVSYTETEINGERIQTRYFDGPLCKSGQWWKGEIQLENR